MAYDGSIRRPLPLRALVLARTALMPQSGEHESLQEQLISCRAMAARMGAMVVSELRMSGWPGSSAAIGHALLDELETWGADIVIVAALDRLSRCADHLKWVMREVNKRGATVVSIEANCGIVPPNSDWPRGWGEG